MMPVLHYFPPSPPCRAVLILGRMLNIEFDLRVVNIMEGDQLKPEFLEVSMRASLIEEKNLNWTYLFQLNPQHSVPTLEDHGLVLSERYGSSILFLFSLFFPPFK